MTLHDWLAVALCGVMMVLAPWAAYLTGKRQQDAEADQMGDVGGDAIDGGDFVGDGDGAGACDGGSDGDCGVD